MQPQGRPNPTRLLVPQACMEGRVHRLMLAVSEPIMPENPGFVHRFGGNILGP